jgi:Ca-activated chloride channel homolog
MLRKWLPSWEDIGLVLLIGALVAGLGILIPRISWGIGLDQVSQGSLLVTDPLSGGLTELPRLHTDVQIAVTGPIARSRLTQRFQNPSNEWAEALYAFPLPHNAAVDSLRMVIGDRTIEGQVREKQEARETYDAAKRAGHKASLVEQHRPNLFSAAVANIPPDGEVEIQIEYQQLLEWRENKFSLRFPMAITPRYIPARDLPPKDVLRSHQNLHGGWQVLPGELPVSIKSATEAADTAQPVNAVRLEVILMPGFPIGDLHSLYHSIERIDNDGLARITLRDLEVPADSDFVLEWGSAEEVQPTAAFFAETTEQGDYGLLIVVPPKVGPTSIPPREVTFIIDTSGSMGIESLLQAKAALLAGLDDLGANDAFNVIEFNSDARKLFLSPQVASPSSIRLARHFVGSLEATGGTEILSAFMAALESKSAVPNRLQQIVFITDGAVGNERDVFQFIQDNLEKQRLFMVGIGSAPNTHFMVESAHFGRGTYTQIGDTADVGQKIGDLFAALKRPVLTDLTLTAEGVSDLVPKMIPDVYSGETVVLAMKLTSEQKKVSLTGRLGAALWHQDFELTHGMHQSGLRINWAREKIRQLIRSEIEGRPSSEVRLAVTTMALRHHLVSPYTSLVAVDVTPSRPSDARLSSTAMKNERVAGMSIQQVQMAQTALGIEGRLLVGFVLMALAALVWIVSWRAALKVRAQC